MSRMSSPVADMKAPIRCAGRSRTVYSNGRKKLVKLRRRQSVEGAEVSSALLPHVAFQDAGIRLAKVEDHQAIHHIGEFFIEIEADQLATDLGVLLDQNRQTFAVHFNVGNWFGEFIDPAQHVADGTAIRAAQFRRAKRRTRLNEPREFARVFAALKVTNDHLARGAAVIVADTNRTEEHWCLRMERDECCDSLPQEQQRRVLALVFRAHKRATEFERRSDLQK